MDYGKENSSSMDLWNGKGSSMDKGSGEQSSMDLWNGKGSSMDKGSGEQSSMDYSPNLGYTSIINLGTSFNAYVFVYENVYKKTNYSPAVEKISNLLNDGSWYDGAISKEEIKHNGRFTSKPSKLPDGIRLGVCKPNIVFSEKSTNSFSYIYITGDQVYDHHGNLVYEGDFQEVAIVRSENQVFYLIDDLFLFSSYLNKFDIAHIYANLFGMGDYIDGAKITNGGDTSAGLPQEAIESYLSSISFETSTEKEVIAAGGDKQVGADYCYLIAKNSAAIANDNHITGKGGAPSFELKGKVVDQSLEKSILSGFIPSVNTNAQMLSGGIVNSDTEFQNLKGVAFETDYLGGSFSVEQGFLGVGFLVEADDSDIVFYESINYHPTYFGRVLSAIAFFEQVEVGSFIDLLFHLDLSFYEILISRSELTINSIIELMINELVSIGSTEEEAKSKDRAIQYSVNSENGAVSRYSNYDFIGYARAGNKTYAIDRTSLYLIDGSSTDDGRSIAASIDFGASNYGTSQLKRVSSIYAGINTDGRVYFRVMDSNNSETVYLANDYGGEVRAKTAKGLISSHWRVKLEVADASTIDLDSVEVEVGVSQRRLGRGR